jgi:hypothetical protein
LRNCNFNGIEAGKREGDPASEKAPSLSCTNKYCG